MYPRLFKNRYPPEVLKGRDWINNVSPEDRAAFVYIGLEAADHGKKGGEALVQRHGKKHMKDIARRGALVKNVLAWWRKQVQEEQARLGLS